MRDRNKTTPEAAGARVMGREEGMMDSNKFEEQNPYAKEARNTRHQIGWHELSLAILALACEIAKLAPQQKGKNNE